VAEEYLAKGYTNVKALFGGYDAWKALEADDQTGPTTLTFDPLRLFVSEGTAFARVTIKLTGEPTTDTVTASLTTTGHSATGGQDYTTTTVNLSFAPGERIKTVDVPILEDLIVEEAGHFHAVLFNIVNALAGETSVEVVINDNDV
jgi:hypothetical protein